MVQVTSIFPQLLFNVCQCIVSCAVVCRVFPSFVNCSSLFRLVDACTSCFRVPSARFYRSLNSALRACISMRAGLCGRRFEISPRRGTLDDGRQESRRERESTRELKRTYFRGFFWYVNSEHRILTPFPPLLPLPNQRTFHPKLVAFLTGVIQPLLSPIADTK